MTAATRILVVDDDATTRLLMSAALENAGFSAVVAASGHEALEQFSTDRFDMVMLDVEMPGLDGYEVCTAIRAQAGDLLPIVMVTGMDDVHSVEKAYDSGATDFIAKPMNWALLGHRARYLLRGYQGALALRAADERNAAILQAIPDLLFELDSDGRYVDYHSPRSDLLAAPAEAFLGRTVSEILPPEAAEACMSALRTAAENGVSTGKQFSLQLAQGVHWFELSVSRKAAAPGARPSFIALSRDITERKEAEQRILRLAYFDNLTGLPNRQSFLERVNREIRRAQQRGSKLGVLFLDLDGFKNINDTMGHTNGDLILQWTADRLRQAMRPSDLVWHGPSAADDAELARLGGDEFTALVLDIAHPEDSLVVAHRLLQLMRRPFVLEGREVVLTTSIGVAVYPDDGQDALTLLKHADTAMYHAKDQGRNNCQLYSASLTEQAMQRMNLERNLRLALERGEFRLEYQPQIDLQQGRVLSAEALIRWQSPDQGTIPPAHFIPLAEENGLIIPIGNWVLRSACTDAAAWGRSGQQVRVAVNLSPLQLKDPDLMRTVQDALARSGLPAERLELEVTESAVMEDSSTTLATLNALRSHGVRIALDDFGTGYSSMSYLKRLPLNNLKVDRSFVRGLPSDEENRAIVRAILSLGASLGLAVTAEGVETIEQANALREMACGVVQGFYFSRPVPAREIPALLNKRWPTGIAAFDLAESCD